MQRVKASDWIRQLRGGAQAHLLTGNDGHHYCVKYSNNPQHRRVLINECLGATLLRYLQITTPDVVILEVSQELISKHDIALEIGHRRLRVPPGPHFASRYPADPTKLAIYDFLPDALLSDVFNVGDFVGALVFDAWVGNADARQAIFIRDRVRRHVPATDSFRRAFVALFTDQGHILGGCNWDKVAYNSLYFRPCVYSSVRSMHEFEPYLDRIHRLPDNILDDTVKDLPSEWIADDHRRLERAIAQLNHRKANIPQMLRTIITGRPDIFINWNKRSQSKLTVMNANTATAQERIR